MALPKILGNLYKSSIKIIKLFSSYVVAQDFQQVIIDKGMISVNKWQCNDAIQ